MIYFFYAVHVVICLFLILVVLLQQGKGADLSVFGGGSTMTAFGARGAATLLHRLTVYGFIGFIVTTLAIGILQGQQESRTVMSEVEAVAPAAGDAADAALEDGGLAGEEPAAALPEEEAPLGALPELEEPPADLPVSGPAESGPPVDPPTGDGEAESNP